jgi:hypothetical protein
VFRPSSAFIKRHASTLRHLGLEQITMISDTPQQERTAWKEVIYETSHIITLDSLSTYTVREIWPDARIQKETGLERAGQVRIDAIFYYWENPHTDPSQDDLDDFGFSLSEYKYLTKWVRRDVASV